MNITGIIDTLRDLLNIKLIREKYKHGNREK